MGDVVWFTGGSYSLRVGKYITLAPGAGVMFGSHEPTGAAVKLRAMLETREWVSDVHGIRAFRPSVEESRDTSEGHFSRKIKCWSHKPCELGVTAEMIAHREEREKLWGVRVLLPINRWVSVTAKAGPKHFMRIGLVIIRPEE